VCFLCFEAKIEKMPTTLTLRLLDLTWRMMMMKTMMRISLVLAALASPLLQAQVNGKFLGVDAKAGYTYNSTAPNNQPLCGNGTAFIPQATCGTIYYQTIQLNGTAVTQAATLNFSAAFTASTTAGVTNIDLAGTVCRSNGAGCQPVDGVPTCNANGCFRMLAGGVYKEEWGVSGAVPAGSDANTVPITFPQAFSSTTNLSVVLSADACAQGPCSTGTKNPISVSGNGDLSTSGITAVFIGVVPTGGGGVSLTGTIHAHWHAYGPA
jgi:hypothetical protein